MNKAVMDAQVAIRLPNHLYQALEAESQRKLTSKSTLIRQAVARELGLLERTPRQAGEQAQTGG